MGSTHNMEPAYETIVATHPRREARHEQQSGAITEREDGDRCAVLCPKVDVVDWRTPVAKMWDNLKETQPSLFGVTSAEGVDRCPPRP